MAKYSLKIKSEKPLERSEISLQKRASLVMHLLELSLLKKKKKKKSDKINSRKEWIRIKGIPLKIVYLVIYLFLYYLELRIS